MRVAEFFGSSLYLQLLVIKISDMTDLNRLMHLMQTKQFKVASFSRGTKQENCDNAKIQETQLVRQLNNLINENRLFLKALMSNDSKTGLPYSKEIDLKDGDIYIFATDEYGNAFGKPVMYIDVKVAFISEYRYVFSTITRRSFDNFANQENHYYWVFNMDGTRSVLIDGLMFYKIVNNNNPWNVSKKPGCANNRNEDYIMGKWINEYRKYFEVHA